MKRIFVVLMIAAMTMFTLNAHAQMSLHDIPGEHIITTMLPSTAAGTDKSYGLTIVPFKSTFVDAKLVYESSITGSTTNSFTALIFNGGSAGTLSNVTIANKAYTNGVDATALLPVALTNSSTASDLNLSADDVLIYKSEQDTGSGLTDPIKGIIITIKGR